MIEKIDYLKMKSFDYQKIPRSIKRQIAECRKIFVVRITDKDPLSRKCQNILQISKKKSTS